MTRRQHSAPRRRRTTLSLPADYLSEAQRIARHRKVNLSTVVGEALAEGLHLQTMAERSDEILDRYKEAFFGFSEDELSILDGVILEPNARK